jgi:multidrug efflux pump
VALLGLIALAGMIMRNSVILVDQVQAEMACAPRCPLANAVHRSRRAARPARSRSTAHGGHHSP